MIKKKKGGVLGVLLSIPTFLAIKKFFLDVKGGTSQWVGQSTYAYVPLLLGVAIFIFAIPLLRSSLAPTILAISLLSFGGVAIYKQIKKNETNTSEFSPKSYVRNVAINEEGNYTLHRLIVGGPSSFIGKGNEEKYYQTVALLVKKATGHTLERQHNGLTPLMLAIKYNRTKVFDLLVDSKKVDLFKGAYAPMSGERTFMRFVARIPFLKKVVEFNPLDVAISVKNAHMVRKLADLYKRGNYEFRRKRQLKPMKALGIELKGVKVYEDIQREKKEKRKLKRKQNREKRKGNPVTS